LAQGTDRAEATPLAFFVAKKYQKIRAAGGGREEGLVALVTDCQKKKWNGVLANLAFSKNRAVGVGRKK